MVPVLQLGLQMIKQSAATGEQHCYAPLYLVSLCEFLLLGNVGAMRQAIVAGWPLQVGL